MKGKINKKNSTNILLDSGAGVSSINSKENETGETMTVSSLKYDIAVGSYPVVNVPVETLTFKGHIEGISVKKLKHDAILAVIDQGNGEKILLDPHNASVAVIQPVIDSSLSVPTHRLGSTPEITSDSADESVNITTKSPFDDSEIVPTTSASDTTEESRVQKAILFIKRKLLVTRFQVLQ